MASLAPVQASFCRNAVSRGRPYQNVFKHNRQGTMTDTLPPILVAELFREINAHLDALLRSLSPEDWHRPTSSSERTVKDVAAHLLDVYRAAAGALRQAVPPSIASATATNATACVSMRVVERASTDRHVSAARARLAIQSGSASGSALVRCGSTAMKAAASASCRATCTNSAVTQVCEAIPLAASRRGKPRNRRGLKS